MCFDYVPCKVCMSDNCVNIIEGLRELIIKDQGSCYGVDYYCWTPIARQLKLSMISLVGRTYDLATSRATVLVRRG